MICPRCLENNPDTYRFCGMCGDDLQVANPPAGSAPGKAAEGSGRPPASRRPNPPTAAPSEFVEPISGPSLLGLNQPSADSLREKAFSGFDSYAEPEEEKRAWKRVLLALVIVAALGGAGWLGYNLGWWGGGGKPGATQAVNPGEPANATPTDSAPKSNVDEAKNAAPVETTPPESPAESHPENPSTTPEAKATAPETKADAPAPAIAEPAKKPAPVVAKNEPAAVVRPPSTKRAAPKPAPAALPAADSGEALFRKGEAYLYGRGVPTSCEQAMKYLKSASDKSNARARSTFGTMYATGHCVPRDLPSSYRWFALALRVDPNNQILEKNLSAVWNQMTPPERQLATKSQ